MYWLDKYQNIYIYIYVQVGIYFILFSFRFKKKMVAVIQPINKHFINWCKLSCSSSFWDMVTHPHHELLGPWWLRVNLKPPLNPISSKKSISGSIENSIRHSFQMMFWNRIDYPFGLFNKRLNSVYLLSVFLGKIKYDVLNLVLLNKSFPPGLMFKPEHVYLKNCNDTKRTSSSLTHHSKMH